MELFPLFCDGGLCFYYFSFLCVTVNNDFIFYFFIGVDQQCHVGFKYIVKWLSYIYMYIFLFLFSIDNILFTLLIFIKKQTSAN